jgi:hypothetical protein
LKYTKPAGITKINTPSPIFPTLVSTRGFYLFIYLLLLLFLANFSSRSIGEDPQHQLALNDDGPTQAIAFKKNKNLAKYGEFCKTIP